MKRNPIVRLLSAIWSGIDGFRKILHLLLLLVLFGVFFGAMQGTTPTLPDGAALLTAFTVESIAQSVNHLPLPPMQWIVVGGGRHNQAIMGGLRTRLEGEVTSGEDVNWSGDAVEAQAFGFLAVRSRLGLPISYPGTTGAPQPMSGGVFVPKP